MPTKKISAEGATELCHPLRLYPPAALTPCVVSLPTGEGRGGAPYPQLRCFTRPKAFTRPQDINHKTHHHMKKTITVLLALAMSAALHAQEIEKIDKFPSGYINGNYVNKYKTIDGVLYAVGYEGTKDWILVRYPAGCRNITYTVHPNCRRIARGAFEGAAYLREIIIPETVSYIGDDAFAGCTSLQGIYYAESSPSAVRNIDADHADPSADVVEVARYDLSGRPCRPTDKGVQIIVFSDFTTKAIIAN